MNKTKLFECLALLILVATLCTPAFIILTGEQETHYEYEVKAEQVNEDEMTDGQDIITYENLSEDQQEVLFRAFKKSDHFLGGAEAFVHTDTKYEVFDDWRIIEIRGVPMLVAISGPEQTMTASQSFINLGSIIPAAFGITLGLRFAPVLLYQGLVGGGRNY